MKQKDLTLIIVLTVVSAAVSYFISGKIFVTPANRKQAVETVDVIKAEFPSPDPRYFNSNSIDPTQLIHIGDSNSQNPFKSSNNQ